MSRDFQGWYDRSLLHWGVASAQGLAAGPTLYLASALGLKRAWFFGGKKRRWKWWGFNPYSSIFHESNCGYSIVYIYNVLCYWGKSSGVLTHFGNQYSAMPQVVGFPSSFPRWRHHSRTPSASAISALHAARARGRGQRGAAGAIRASGWRPQRGQRHQRRQRQRHQRRQQQRRCGHRRCAKGEGRTGGTEALGMAWSL